MSNYTTNVGYTSPYTIALSGSFSTSYTSIEPKCDICNKKCNPKVYEIIKHVSGNEDLKNSNPYSYINVGTVSPYSNTETVMTLCKKCYNKYIGDLIVLKKMLI